MRVIALLLLLIVLFPLQTYGDTTNKEVDLTTSPSRILFDLTNIKPGDSVIRNLKIYNNGATDINVIVTNKFLSGSQIFYNQIDLEIQDQGETIYKGKLNRFKKLSPQLLKSKRNKDLNFQIRVPLEIGNEYQGLDSEFQFKLYAEGTLGGLLPANGPKLPETGTNMFNFLVSGIVLFFIGIFSYFYQMRKKY